MDRIIPLKSVRNFRDFGGYETVHGQKVRSGRLFRSAHFSDTSLEDHNLLTELELGLLVDLRHAPERKRQPNKPMTPKTGVYELSERSPHEVQEYAPHEMFLKERLETAEDARQYMLASYSARPHDPVFIDIFSRTLIYMAQQNDALVIHCAAGKDRTGTLAAIIHRVLGVEDDMVLEDYMLTMKAVDIDSFLEPAAKFMTKRFGRPIEPEALRPMFGVQPDFLDASLSAMGDFETYIKTVLGISDEMTAAIRKNYLA